MEKTLTQVKGAHNCKWADLTLFEPAPDWMAAEEFPWTCHRDAVPKHLQTTDLCADCPRWEDRTGGGGSSLPKP